MKISILTVATVLVLGLGAQALAVDEPENVIKYRQSVMKAIGGHTGAIVAVVKGEVGYVGHVAAHARAIHEMSKLLPDLFPKGTGQDNYPETRALPELWNDLAKFEASAKDLQVQSAKLAAVAEGGDLAAIGAQLENLGKACGSCHKPFRAKKK